MIAGPLVCVLDLSVAAKAPLADTCNSAREVVDDECWLRRLRARPTTRLMLHLLPVWVFHSASINAAFTCRLVAMGNDQRQQLTTLPLASPVSRLRLVEKLRLAESDLPVERFFVPRSEEASSAPHSSSGRRSRMPAYFSAHRATARRLTSSGRNFLRAFADLSGGALAELQMIRRTSQHAGFLSLAPHLEQPRKSTFLLVGPGDQGGLLVHGTGSVNLRAGDLWHAETGVGSFQVETTRGYSELLLLRLES